MIESPLALAATIALATAVAFWLEYRFPAVGKVGASMVAIIMGAALSNLGLVPASAPIYGVIGGVVTSLAIAWLLLAVNIADMRRAGPKMIGAFGVAAVGTMIGALVAAFLFQDRLAADGWRLAGTLTGTYIGGSLNFVAVGRAVELPDALFSGAVASDNVATALWLGFTLMAPIWLAPLYPAVSEAGADTDTGTAAPPSDLDSRHAHHPYFQNITITGLQLANLMAVGLVLVVVSEWLGSVLPAVPAILWLTTLALVAGHSPWYRSAPGAMQLGSVALHFFFVLIGILSRASEIVAAGPAVFLFTLTVVLVHGIFTFGMGRILRLDIGTLAVASQAAVGGPSSALAVAVARDWRHLVLPGVIVGLLGYAIGTYLGLAMAQLTRTLF